MHSRSLETGVTAVRTDLRRCFNIWDIAATYGSDRFIHRSIRSRQAHVSAAFEVRVLGIGHDVARFDSLPDILASLTRTTAVRSNVLRVWMECTG